MALVLQPGQALGGARPRRPAGRSALDALARAADVVLESNGTDGDRGPSGATPWRR